MGYGIAEQFIDALNGKMKSTMEKSFASIENYDYVKAMQDENTRFWSDYYKNTGIKPLYPYRAGAVNNIGNLYRAKSQRSRGSYDVGHILSSR